MQILVQLMIWNDMLVNFVEHDIHNCEIYGFMVDIADMNL